MDLSEKCVLLLNSENPLPSDYVVDLENVQGEHQVDKEIAKTVRDMLEDAKSQGVDLLICSSYRTVARQTELFEQRIKKHMTEGMTQEEAKVKAGLSLAIPGHSEHNSGLALDIVTPSLCIIDEIFRGTNSKERIAAASQFLKYISEENALTLVATHDIELTSMVKDAFGLFYFDEDVGPEGLIFDYHLRSGVSPTRNAIKILDYLGYPKEIVDNSNALLNNESTLLYDT